MYGETEEELLQNANKHGKVHGYTEQSWNEGVVKNGEHFRKLIKKTNYLMIGHKSSSIFLQIYIDELG